MRQDSLEPSGAQKSTENDDNRRIHERATSLVERNNRTIAYQCGNSDRPKETRKKTRARNNLTKPKIQISYSETSTPS